MVVVLNGTPTDGLATMVSTRLEAAGYTLEPPGNAGSVDNTTLYYQSGQRVNADFLRDKQFPDARLAPATDQFDFQENVDITVVLGRDFNP